MASSTPSFLQQIYQLDKSSPNFPILLDTLLHGKEYEQCARILGVEDAGSFIDYLDEVVSILEPSSPASRKCLRELKTICGTKALVPTSFALPTNLLKVDPIPFASGGFGDVYKGTFRNSTVCIKRMRVSAQAGVQTPTKMFCKEAAMWKYLEHPNVLPLMGVTISPPQLVSKWISAGELPEYIRTNPDTDRLKLLRDIAIGLNYLHARNVIHGDLKGINVLVEDVKGSPCAIIADFGIAAVTRNLDSLRPATRAEMHSPRWTAPELLEGGLPSKESDIYSFSMVTIEVFTGQLPFHSQTEYLAVFSVLSGGRPPRPPHPDCTDTLWALIESCWNKNAKSRPGTSEILRVIAPGMNWE